MKKGEQALRETVDLRKQVEALTERVKELETAAALPFVFPPFPATPPNSGSGTPDAWGRKRLPHGGFCACAECTGAAISIGDVIVPRGSWPDGPTVRSSTVGDGITYGAVEVH